MPRTARIAPGGIIQHVLNRGVGKSKLFRGRKDYEAFQRCLIEAMEKIPMRVLGYCVMPNHWHLLLWPKRDGDLGRFMMQLTNTHVRRWMTAHDEVGSGHLYQGRYKNFAMENDEHLSTVERYIARNAVRAKLVDRAEQWKWSAVGQGALVPDLRVPLTASPQPRRSDWLEWVNLPQTPTEEAAIRACIAQNRPYGDARWLGQVQKRLGWREPGKPGRPKKKR
jgi:putative transposase